MAGVARLLTAGADPNASVSGRTSSGEVVQSTALGLAVANGRLEVARLLLDAGADPSRAGGDGTTPVIQAAGNGRREVLRLLLARGAAVDTVRSGPGSTAFHLACANNQAECAEELTRVGCDVGIKDNVGQTGREVAEGKGHAAVLARLRAVVGEQLRAAQTAGPEPEPTPAAVAGDAGPADQLAQAAAEGDGAAVGRLLAAGADPNALVRRAADEVVHSTALAAAAALGQVEATRLLLDAGADPSLAGGGCFTPLMAAAKQGQLEVLRLLMARGAAVDAVEPTEGWTAFHLACYHNQAECAEALARAGCDVGIKSNNGKAAGSGQTGLEVAEGRGHAAGPGRPGAVKRP
jgi:ankyrin repeat protein